MRPLKFQQAYLRKILQLWFFLMVLIPWITALHETEGDKTYNLKIGFDLTRGSQGAPSLRIRNFEDNDDTENSPRALRARSSEGSSSSNEKKKDIPSAAIEMKAADDNTHSEDTDESDGGRKQRSTKGLRADEFEPQGPDVREMLDNDSDSENST